MDAKDRTEQRFYSAIDAGFIAQNVYLYCASEGLATKKARDFGAL